MNITRAARAACRSLNGLKDVVISLPMHSDLDAATQDKIIAAVASFKS